MNSRKRPIVTGKSLREWSLISGSEVLEGLNAAAKRFHSALCDEAERLAELHCTGRIVVTAEDVEQAERNLLAATATGQRSIATAESQSE